MTDAMTTGCVVTTETTPREETVMGQEAVTSSRGAIRTPRKVETDSDTPNHPENVSRSPRYTCGGCDNTWGGISRAHCPACHITTSTANLFDLHRRDVKGIGTCLDPSTIVNQTTGVPMMKLVDGIWKSAAEWSGSTHGSAT